MAKKQPKSRFRRKPLAQTLGDVPVHDSLATIDYAIKALGESLKEVDKDPTLKPAQKRAEIIRITTAMAKLQNPARMYAAEQTLRGFDQRVNEAKNGPELQPVPPAGTDDPPARRAPAGWRPGSNRGLG